VTSVGATTGYPRESGAGLSAGGFSDIFPRPSYQSTHVDGYLNKIGDMYAGRFNKSGRAFPDVTTQSQRVMIVRSLGVLVDGTSASAPIFASVISLINEQLIDAGKQLGFLNPFLYSRGQGGLNDIISGNNLLCGTNGFSAQAGWDPVNGLGTPDFAGLMKATGA